MNNKKNENSRYRLRSEVLQGTQNVKTWIGTSTWRSDDNRLWLFHGCSVEDILTTSQHFN